MRISYVRLGRFMKSRASALGRGPPTSFMRDKSSCNQSLTVGTQFHSFFVEIQNTFRACRLPRDTVQPNHGSYHVVPLELQNIPSSCIYSTYSPKFIFHISSSSHNFAHDECHSPPPTRALALHLRTPRQSCLPPPNMPNRIPRLQQPRQDLLPSNLHTQAHNGVIPA